MLLHQAVIVAVLYLAQVLSATVDPSRLLVATVVDVSRPSIVADSLLLFRSIRLFGGALSRASLLACVIVDPRRAFLHDDLLTQLVELGVELCFARQVNAPFARTMNKFSAFLRHDPDRFDHFLWLDADVLVLADPLPLLPVQLQAGAIYCVPEMNNYMRRFPAWNATAYGSSPQPPFNLLNEADPAPHGVCNMGVLLFDSAGLAAFLLQLRDPAAMRALQPHCRDRFFDSLTFVAGVHRGCLQVLALPPDLNYFALLEEEVEAAAARGQIPPPAPRMAHFMADSSLEILSPEQQQQQRGDEEREQGGESGPQGGACSCVLRRDYPFQPSSLLCALVAARCPALCQLHRPLPRSVVADSAFVDLCNGTSDGDPSATIVAAVSPQGEDGSAVLLQVLWPVPGAMLLSRQDKVLVEGLVRHCSPAATSAEGLALDFTLFSAYSLARVHSECAPDPSSPALRTCCETALQVEGTLSGVAGKELYLELAMSVLLPASQPGAPPLQEVVFLRVARPHLLPHSHTGFRSVHQHQHQQDSFVGRRAVAVGGGAPHILSSQLELAHLLNLRGLLSLGVVLCCDSEVGLQTAARLVHEWGHSIQVDPRLHAGGLGAGRVLVLAVQGRHPKGSRAVAMELATMCDSRVADRQQDGLGEEHQLGCVVVQDPDVFVAISEHIRRSRAGLLSFVYTDVFTSLSAYTRSLQQWFSVLVPGGMLVGSRYHVPVPPARASSASGLEDGSWLAGLGGAAPQVRSAVDACALQWSVPVFVTYFEMWQEQQEQRVVPAWYVFNNARSPAPRSV